MISVIPRNVGVAEEKALRQENKRVRDPTMKRALAELLVPSLTMKMGPGTETGIPDTIFWIPHGRPLLIEFKWDELEPEPKQLYWHGVFGDLQYEVQVHNSVQEALTAIAVEVVAATLHAEGCKIPLRAWRSNFDAGPRFAEDLHYTRSFQFLKEARGSETNARYRTIESVLSSMARRNY
jgi:hypothetical protein